MKLKKLWNFIWNDNSWASWIVNVVLAIVIIKFILFPFLGFALGTSFPVVAVVSCSMQHEPTNCWADCYLRGKDLGQCKQVPETLCNIPIDTIAGDFEYWDLCGELYEDKGINQEDFEKFPENNGFNIGDIFILKKAEDLKVGDVIVFDGGRGSTPIIHRIVVITEKNGEKFYTTKGDWNGGINEFEQSIPEDRVFGKVLLKVPYLGWVKIGFNMFTRELIR